MAKIADTWETGCAMAQMRIKDIAAEAGVSPATVSRYLNNRPGQMTEETRARIAAVIERTGYRPRAAARNLRSSRTNLIGVILADIGNPFSSAMLEGLSASAAARGSSLMTAISGNDPAKEAESLTRLIDAGVDGLIVNTCGGNDKAIAAAAGRLPVVLLDRDVANGGIDLVTSNNRELVAGLVDALVAAGSEHLCLLTEASDDSPVRRERAEAFADELSRRGLTGEVVTLADGGAAGVGLTGEVVTLADGGAAGVGRLDEAIRDYAGKKLGLIAVNGLVFLRLTEALAQLGPSLPAGLKIATFDDYPWNHVLFGGVTTAAQDTLTIAERVVERLSERIDVVTTTVGDAAKLAPKLAPKRIEIPGHIEHRASTSR